MRFNLISLDRAKACARALRANLDEPRTLGACQAAVACALGYRDWAELKRAVGTAPPSAFDHEVPPAEREERRRYQARALAQSLGLPHRVAAGLVDVLGLTASHADPSRPSLDGFIAGMGCQLTEDSGSLEAFGQIPDGNGRLGAKAVLREKPGCAWPDVRAIVVTADGDEPFPTLESCYGPDGWLSCIEMLGWRSDAGAAPGFVSALHAHLGRPPSEAEVGRAWREWTDRLGSSGILRLGDRVDQSVFALATQSGFDILDTQEGYRDFRDVPENRLFRAVASAYPLLAGQAWASPELTDEFIDDVAGFEWLASGRGLTAASDMGGAIPPLPRTHLDWIGSHRTKPEAWTEQASGSALRYASLLPPDVLPRDLDGLDAFTILANMLDATFAYDGVSWEAFSGIPNAEIRAFMPYEGDWQAGLRLCSEGIEAADADQVAWRAGDLIQELVMADDELDGLSGAERLRKLMARGPLHEALSAARHIVDEPRAIAIVQVEENRAVPVVFY